MKIVTAPRKLTPRARLVHDTELKIRRVYDLGNIINLRQKRSIIEGLLVDLLLEYDKLPAKQHGGRYEKYANKIDTKPIITYRAEPDLDIGHKYLVQRNADAAPST